MSIKKLLILSAAGLAAVTSAAAFAGGPDEMEQSLFAPAIYMDVHGGYSFYNWNGLVANNSGVIFFDQHLQRGHGGGMGGGDVGLQVFKNIAVEVGGFYLPRVKGVSNTATDVSTPSCAAGNSSLSCTQGQQYNWAAYAAGRFNVHMPYIEGLDMFAKVGAVWRAMSNHDFSANRGGMRHYWDVIFGAGFDYDLMNSGFNVGVQWMHIPGHIAGTNTAGAAGDEDTPSNRRLLSSMQPAQDLVTGSVGYKFDF